MESDQYKEKLSLINELIHLSRLDDEEIKLEKEFILYVAEKLGISSETVKLLYKREIEFTPPENEFRRIFHFQSIVLLMGIDQKITKEELDFCRDIGIRMGLNVWSVETLLKAVIEAEGNAVPGKKVIEIFKAGYN